MQKTTKSKNRFLLRFLLATLLSFGAACSGDDLEGGSDFDPTLGEVGDLSDLLEEEEDLEASIGTPDDPRDVPVGPGFLADNQLGAHSITVMDNTVFWVAQEDGKKEFRQVSVLGGHHSKVASVNPGSFDYKIVDDIVVFTDPVKSGLFGVEFGSDKPEMIIPDDGRPLVLDAVDGHTIVYGAVDGSIVRASLGGDSELLDQVDETPIDLQIVDGYVYWSTVEGSIYRTPLEGNDDMQKLVGGHTFNADLSIDYKHIYWVNGDDRAVYRILRDGNGQQERIAHSQFAPAGITQDRFYIYFTTQSDHLVKRVLKSGGPVEPIVFEQHTPSEIVATDTAIYWISEGFESIMKFGR